MKSVRRQCKPFPPSGVVFAAVSSLFSRKRTDLFHPPVYSIAEKLRRAEEAFALVRASSACVEISSKLLDKRTHASPFSYLPLVRSKTHRQTRHDKTTHSAAIYILASCLYAFSCVVQSASHLLAIAIFRIVPFISLLWLCVCPLHWVGE